MIILIYLVLFFVIIVMMINEYVSHYRTKTELEQIRHELNVEYTKNRHLQLNVNRYQRICDDKTETIKKLYQENQDLQEKIFNIKKRT